jgi:hypothetical protein
VLSNMQGRDNSDKSLLRTFLYNFSYLFVIARFVLEAVLFAAVLVALAGAGAGLSVMLNADYSLLQSSVTNI